MAVTHALFPKAAYIDNRKTFKNLIKTLSRESEIAIDTESNSMHSYFQRVCLIQISTHERDYIVDPITIENIEEFGGILANPAIEKVLHAAEYDLICLRNEYGFEVENLFDTQIAAQLCGVKSVGLGNVLKKHFDVHVDKSHQRDDWGKRPLPEDSLYYAQMDTHYLLELREIEIAELGERGRVEEARELFQDAARYIEPKPNFDPDGFWHLGKPYKLNRKELAVLRELYIIRDQVARKKDTPPLKVFSNQELVTIARNMPQTWQDLEKIENISPKAKYRYGDELVAAVQKGFDEPLPKPPRNPMPPPEVADRFSLLQAWRKECAIERGVESNLVMPRQALWDLARKFPASKSELSDIEGLGPWRINEYGDAVLNVLHSNGSGQDQ